jgi:hypothetical protein
MTYAETSPREMFHKKLRLLRTSQVKVVVVAAVYQLNFYGSGQAGAVRNLLPPHLTRRFLMLMNFFQLVLLPAAG